MTSTIRPMSADDRPYVLETWRRSMQQKSRKNQRDVSHSRANRARERLADEHRVLVASVADGSIIGWICYTPLRSSSVVHYLYVRASFRAHTKNHDSRVSRDLMEAAGVDLAKPVLATKPVTARGRMVAASNGIRLHEVEQAEVMP